MLLLQLKRVIGANLLPALALQALSAFLFYAYFVWPAGHAALEHLGVVKQTAGAAFAFIASAVSGAVLPFCLQGLQRGQHRRLGWAAAIALTVFYGVRGWLIDGFYILQSQLWGDKTDLPTLLIKIFCDLGVFSPLLAIPSVILMYSWVDAGFNWGRYRAQFTHGWYRRCVWPTLVMAWLVWLPALFVLYALPTSLQFPVQIIIQCFWALVLVVVTDQKSATAHSGAPSSSAAAPLAESV